MTLRQRITSEVSEVFVISITLTLFFCTSNLAFAQVLSRPAAVFTQTELQSIHDALDSDALKTAFVGIEIADASTNRILVSENADRLFEPASCCKILTSAAAITVLGMKFRFETDLALIGSRSKPHQSTADVVLIGHGDPVLNTRDLLDLAHQLKGKVSVVRRLEYYDGSFDSQRLGAGWAWDDEPYYYSPQFGGLNCCENVVSLSFRPGKIGRPPQVVENPVLPQLRIVNRIVTIEKPDNTDIHFTRTEGRNEIQLSGTISRSPSGTQKNLAVLTFEHPGKMTALLAIDALRAQGIKVLQSTPIQIAEIPPNVHIVASHLSVPLARMLTLMNKPSDNLIAECLLQACGLEAAGKSTLGFKGTALTTTRAALATMGANLSELHQVDGSGLSRQDFVSPANLVTILASLRALPEFQIFFQSLPIAGVDGPLAWRMKHTRAANNCHAKTGYLSGVSTIAGYVTGRDGTPFIFAIMINNHVCSEASCQQAQNAIIELLANHKTIGRAN